LLIAVVISSKPRAFCASRLSATDDKLLCQLLLCHAAATERPSPPDEGTEGEALLSDEQLVEQLQRQLCKVQACCGLERVCAAGSGDV
jgi:hypothetical protein